MLGLATLFQGCGESKESPTAAKKTVDTEKTTPDVTLPGVDVDPIITTVSGKATLASISDSAATVCIDINNNKACDENEPKTTTDNEGAYTLSTEKLLENGMLIIVSHGYNIIKFKDANDTLSRNLTFYKSYQTTDDAQNVNIISTLIADQLEVNGDNDYQLAIDTFANEYPGQITNNYSLFGSGDYVVKADLILDPIDEAAGWFFGWFGSDKNLLNLNGALQNIIKDKNSSRIQTKAPSRAANATTQENGPLPTEDELNNFYNTSGDYFKDLLSFIEDFINWISSTDDDSTELPEEETPVVGPEVTQAPILRDSINGIWYIIDKSGDKTCADITADDKISVTDTADKITDLDLTYDQINKDQASILLKLGFFTADTIIFDKYMSDRTFEGHYASDGETLKGSPIDTLANCKATKLN